MKSADISKLCSIIDDKSKTATEQMLYRDTFALACYLHAEGQKSAGLKLCNELFDHLDRHRRSTYFASITSTLDGNEETYARAVSAHHEINKLFMKKGG